MYSKLVEPICDMVKVSTSRISKDVTGTEFFYNILDSMRFSVVGIDPVLRCVIMPKSVGTRSHS